MIQPIHRATDIGRSPRREPGYQKQRKVQEGFQDQLLETLRRTDMQTAHEIDDQRILPLRREAIRLAANLSAYSEIIEQDAEATAPSPRRMERARMVQQAGALAYEAVKHLEKALSDEAKRTMDVTR